MFIYLKRKHLSRHLGSCRRVKSLRIDWDSDIVIVMSQDGGGTAPAEERTVAQAKTDQRSGRFGNPLGIRKGSEALVDQRLREELVEKALKLCYNEQKAFADCAKKYGMGVIFMCRQENDQMNECLHRYTSDEALAKYKLELEESGIHRG
eukprot:g5062.t1